MPFPNLTQGAAREAVSAADVQRLRSTGVLVEDPRRERPRWFDGRFLAARDLIREQQYVLTREADLGRAAGSGVADGLRVTAAVEAQSLQIDAGHGVTPAGELVLLPRPLSVALANVAQAEQLSARFGLGRIPNAPLRSRTGLFVVALRPVEYTANPIGAYPSSLTGQRTVEDGDTIEATAVVLVPWPDDGAADALDARRGRAAREVFVAGGGAGLSANVLPLALVALRNNTLDWVDEALVRRELGADRGDLPGLGFSPRALRLAHLMQYQDHLADVVARAAGSPFSAAAWFPALPSAGPLPAGLIDTRDFTQGFFPAEIDVDFSPVPDDELPALIEDALLLQPIDLQASADALDSTAVLIVAPVPRSDWRAVTARLAGTSRVVKPAAPNLLAQRKPFEVLQRLRLPRAALPVPDATNPSDTEWQRLARLPNLWFVRRRHLAITDDYTGAWQGVAGADERSTEAAVRSRVDALGLSASLQRVMDQATPAAAGTITNLLASKRLVDSAALTAATIGALSDAARAGAATAASGAAAAGGAAVAGPGATSPAGPAVAAAAAAPAVAAGPAPGAPAAAVPALPTRPSAQAAVPTLDLASVLKVAGDMSRPAVGAGLMRVEQAAGAAPLRPDTLRRIASNTEWKKLDTRAAQATPQAVQALSRGLNAPVGAPSRAPAAPALQPVAAQPASAAPTADAAQPKPAGPPADAEPLKPAEPAAAQPASAAPAADAAQPESAAPAAAQSVSAAPAAAQPVSAAPAADAAQPESAAPAAAQPAAPASAAALPAAQPVGPPAGRPGGAPIASSVFESPAASATLHVPPPANVAPRPAFAASTVVAAPRSFAPTAVAAAAATAAAATALPATEALAAPFASLAEGAAPAAATASIDPGDSPTRSGQIARREAGNAPST